MSRHFHLRPLLHYFREGWGDHRLFLFDGSAAIELSAHRYAGSLSAGVDIGGDEYERAFMVHLRLIWLWLSFSCRLPLPAFLRRTPRSWSAAVDMGGGCVSGLTLRGSFGAPTASWSRGQWRFYWCPFDTLLGRHGHAGTTIHADDYSVRMPEATYPATVEVQVETWTRPRWPWWPCRLQVVSTEVRVEGGVPFPGKGENSYDCGEDAAYSSTIRHADVHVDVARSIPFAVAQAGVDRFIAGVMRDRERNGGAGWRPKPRT